VQQETYKYWRSSPTATATRPGPNGCTRHWKPIACRAAWSDGRLPQGRFHGACSRCSAISRNYQLAQPQRCHRPGAGTVALSHRHRFALCGVSKWVDQEIARFRAMGRGDRILCLIVDGEPNADLQPGKGFLSASRRLCAPVVVSSRSPQMCVQVRTEGRRPSSSLLPVWLAWDWTSYGNAKADVACCRDRVGRHSSCCLRCSSLVCGRCSGVSKEKRCRNRHYAPILIQSTRKGARSFSRITKRARRSC